MTISDNLHLDMSDQFPDSGIMGNDIMAMVRYIFIGGLKCHRD